MPILTFSLQNDTENDADQVNQLLQELEAVLDGGIGPANLQSGFTLDAQTQLTNNKIEVLVNLRFSFAATLTAAIKDWHQLLTSDYTLVAARASYSMTNGTGAPSGSPSRVTFTVKAGSYSGTTFTAASTLISTQTIYATQTEGTSIDLTSSIVTSQPVGPNTLVLSIDGVPATNPPTSGFLDVVLKFTRSPQ